MHGGLIKCRRPPPCVGEEVNEDQRLALRSILRTTPRIPAYRTLRQIALLAPTGTGQMLCPSSRRSQSVAKDARRMISALAIADRPLSANSRSPSKLRQHPSIALHSSLPHSTHPQPHPSKRHRPPRNCLAMLRKKSASLHSITGPLLPDTVSEQAGHDGNP